MREDGWSFLALVVETNSDHEAAGPQTLSLSLHL